MKDAPAFDFYPERWTHGTRLMSKVERCDYIDLLCQQWTDDGIPADLDLLARLLGYKKASQISPFLLEKFPISDDGKRRNPRLEIERGKQRERIEKRRSGAQITNAKRWKKESLSDRSATVERVASESPPPTTHPSPHVLLEKEPKGVDLDLVPEIEAKPRANKGKASNPEEVIAYAATQGIPQISAEDFFDKMEAGGWKRGKEPVKDWQSHFRTMARNGWLATGTPPGQSASQPREAPKSFAQLDREAKDAARHGPERIIPKVLTLESLSA